MENVIPILFGTFGGFVLGVALGWVHTRYLNTYYTTRIEEEEKLSSEWRDLTLEAIIKLEGYVAYVEAHKRGEEDEWVLEDDDEEEKIWH